MKTKVVITVDTEPSTMIAGAFADPKRYKPCIHEPVWGEVGAKVKPLDLFLKR